MSDRPGRRPIPWPLGGSDRRPAAAAGRGRPRLVGRGPPAELDKIPVAIVNNDTILTDPQPMAAGRALSASLTDPKPSATSSSGR